MRARLLHKPSFLADVFEIATGIAFIYQSSLRVSALSSYTVISNYGISYYSITALLNVLLTIMIITRLILQSRNIRNAMGGSTGATRTYTAVIVMIVESYALYTVTFLVFLGLWAAKNSAINAFFPFLVQVQVSIAFVHCNGETPFVNRGDEQAIAPFLITLRVANQNVVKGRTTVSGNDHSIHFRSHGKSAGSNGTLPDGYSMSTRDKRARTSFELGVAIETTVNRGCGTG